MKRSKELERMHDTVSAARHRNLCTFEKRHGSRITDFDFKPGALVLVWNSQIKEALNRKTKPRYIGPMVVVRKTIGTSYIIAELDGAQSQLRVAGFRLIPYFARTETSILIITGVSDTKDFTEPNPKDLDYLSSMPPESRKYRVLSPPKFSNPNPPDPP
jgi:hypothetical protein